MQGTRSSSALRRLTKQIILCLILGAVLQYVVAVGFSSLGRSWGVPDEAAEFHFGDQEPTFYLILEGYTSVGRDILVGNLFLYGPARGEAAAPLDWRKGAWFDPESFEFEAESAPKEIPAWSRFRRTGSDPPFEYYPSALTPSLSVEVGSGWPARSASYIGTAGDAGPFVVREGIAISNLNVDFDATPRVVPLRIHWHGAIVNTLLYAPVLLVPCTLVPFGRRHLRRRAGQCTACGYDLRGTAHAACPECGAEIYQRSTML